MQGQQEKKYFLSEDSRLNSDDAAFAVSPNSWVNLENCRTGTTDKGVTGVVESIGGTLLLSTPQPSINYLGIGSAADDENGRFAEFKFNTTGTQHKITCYYKSTGIEYDVLLSSQVTGGLNFSKNSPIHSAVVVNGLLYWVDGTNNQPRKINLEAAIKGNYPSFVTTQAPYTFPLNFSEITIIKPTAALAPNIQKDFDATFLNNFIANNAFEFSHQFIWYDNETTVTGCYSVNSRLNTPTEDYNRVVVTMSPFQLIPSSVRIVNLVVRYSNENNAFVVKTWDREVGAEATEIDAQNDGSALLTYNFYNSISGEFLAPVEVLRPFDDVPLYSETIEAFKNRIGLANNEHGMNTPATTSFALRRGTTIELSSSSQNTPLIALRYGYGGLGPDYGYSGWYVYLSFAQVPGYYLINGTDTTSMGSPNFPPLPAKPTSVVYTTGLTFKGATVSETIVNTKPPSTAYPTRISETTDGSIVTITGISQTTYNVMSQLGVFYGGIVFYDFAMRKCGVSNHNPNTSYTLYKTSGSAINFLIPGANTVAIVNSFGAYIAPGDRIEIVSTASAGTYTVSEVEYNIGLSSYVLTIVEPAPTIVLSSSVINIYIPNSTFVKTPRRTFTYNTAISGLDWSLSNTDALNEIPEEAYYYCPVLTLNQRTRFFVQAFTNTAKYATKDINGNYVFTSTIFLNTVVGIGINTEALVQAQLGYTFTEGDICILIRGDNDYFQIPVIGQDGNYIILKAEDIGNLNNIQFVYEIYTPYKTSANEPYFEMGGMMQIDNPGTALREYSILSGSFRSDSYAITRNYSTFTYFAGAMSPNDLFYKRWDNDGGKINVVTKLGRLKKGKYIIWSDNFIPNTAINGLSTFRSENQIPVPEDCGDIYKLVLTSKVQAEGTVMLSICANETNSLYLQETQVTDSTGATQFFAASDNVISTINTLKGSRGTTHPTSVIRYRGNVYWWDNLNGKIVQYSVNGLFDISDYKMVRFWNLFTLQFNSMTPEEIEALGSRPFVFGGIDPMHSELLFSIPKLSNTPPKGYLPDYSDKIYPFDILDFQRKSIVYKLDLGLGNPKWLGSYSITAETFISINNELYSIKNGHLYLHNQPNYNEIYGVQYSTKIMIVANAELNKPKVYNNISSESNLVPSFVYFYSEYPIQQASDLVDLDFKNLEGIFYATIFRNKLIPTAAGYTTDGLLTGEKMRNTAMMIMLEWRVGTTPLQLKFINIGFQVSLGNPV